MAKVCLPRLVNLITGLDMKNNLESKVHVNDICVILFISDSVSLCPKVDSEKENTLRFFQCDKLQKTNGTNHVQHRT